MTVALPVLSACGVETCVLPSAVLSTHTGGFSGCTFRDLSGDFPAIQKHWAREGITFDVIYTGYLGSVEQIGMVKEMFDRFLTPGGIAVVDPAMADNGVLYKGFDDAYARAMTELCGCADIIIPNITEACMLTGTEFCTSYDEAYIARLMDKLCDLGSDRIVLTGVGFAPEQTGVFVRNCGEDMYYSHSKLPKNYHGTGDIFASALVGAHARGADLPTAARIAADFTTRCIENTYKDTAHWYGVKFETALPVLIGLLSDQIKDN
jgi:pyridoxine kinase